MLHLQMQQCGQPPQEIVDELAPGMQVQVLPYRQSYCGGAGRTLQSPISAHQAANRPCQQPPFLPVHASSCFPTSALCAAAVWAGWATDIWRRWSWGGGPAARAAGLRHSVSTRNAGRPRQAQAPPRRVPLQLRTLPINLPLPACTFIHSTRVVPSCKHLPTTTKEDSRKHAGTIAA